MLFTKVFNYLKLRTLPSSVLAKNRLFIERDSKHRRVTSNFGTTFRNSKWSDYSVKNVSASQKSTFMSFVFNTLIMFILIYISYVYYYASSIWFFGVLFDSIYSGFELTHQSYLYFQFLLPMVLHNFSLLLGKLGLTHPSINPTTNVNSPNTPTFETTNFNLDLYSLVNSSNNHLISVFDTPSSINKLGLPIQSLYQVVNLSPKATTLVGLNNNSNISNEYQLLDNKHAYYYNILTSSISLVPQDTKSFDNIWLNTLLQSELLNKPGFIKGTIGSFYAKDLTWHDLNNLVVTNGVFGQLSDNLRDQTRMIELHRWLYKYNVLHRKTLINSHKTTMAKKLLSTGFFDSTLTRSNIWASDFFSKTTDNSSKIIKNEFRLLYNDMHMGNSDNFGSKFELVLNQPKTTFKLLSFYETSFHFYVKRFFLFNNLGVNNITTSVYNSTDSINPGDLTNMESYRLLSTIMWLSPNNSSNIFNVCSTSTDLTIGTQPKGLRSFSKDVTLILNDCDALSNDQLENALDLTGSVMTTNSTVYYHSILSNVLDQFLVDTSVTFTPSAKSNGTNYRLSHSSIDAKLLTDAYSVMGTK